MRYLRGFERSQITAALSLMKWLSMIQGCSQTYGKPLRDLQQVNCLWGAVDMTRKNLFFRLLRAAFGTQLASSINPMTYFLPEDYFDAADYIHGQVWDACST